MAAGKRASLWLLEIVDSFRGLDEEGVVQGMVVRIVDSLGLL